MTPSKLLFAVAFVVLHALIGHNVVALSQDMLYGDGSGEALAPLPVYRLKRLPEISVTVRVHAQHRLAADFAQVYFHSQDWATMARAYTRPSADPWTRPSRYAPVVHVACSLTLCRLSYGAASVVHMAVQLLVFYASFLYAFRTLRLERYLAPAILVVNVALFLTPAGLSWFERGQFGLYVASAYLWLMLGILRRNPLHVALSALFALVKLTALPFVAVTLCVWVIGSSDRSDLRARLRLASAFPLVFVPLVLIPYPWSVGFLAGLVDQEVNASPFGLSLALLFPRLAKVLPLGLIAWGVVHVRGLARDTVSLVPFLTGAGSALIAYPTLAFDYSAATLLAFIPLLRHWGTVPGTRDRALRRALPLLLPAFIVTVSFSHALVGVLLRSRREQMYVYVLGAAVFLLLPLVRRRPAPGGVAGDRATSGVGTEPDGGETLPARP